MGFISKAIKGLVGGLLGDDEETPKPITPAAPAAPAAPSADNAQQEQTTDNGVKKKKRGKASLMVDTASTGNSTGLNI